MKCGPCGSNRCLAVILVAAIAEALPSNAHTEPSANVAKQDSIHLRVNASQKKQKLRGRESFASLGSTLTTQGKLYFVQAPHSEAYEANPTQKQAIALGVSVPFYAFLLATGSGLSLPFGALMGIELTVVRQASPWMKSHIDTEVTLAAMMAFGAGALLFAVTVELYGHALHEVHKGHMSMTEMNIVMVFAIGGALFYLWVTRLLEEYFEPEETEGEEKRAETKHAVEDKPAKTKSVLANMTNVQKLRDKATRDAAKRSWKKLRMAVFKASVLSKMMTAGEADTEEAQPAVEHTESKYMLNRTATGQARASKSLKKFAEVLGDAILRIAEREAAATNDELAEKEKTKQEEAAKAKLVALEMFVGLLIDGVPEGILMGIMAAEGHLTPVLIISLFIANFPEAFSSATLLKNAEMGTASILAMWTGLCLLVGSLCGGSCWFLIWMFPKFADGGEALPHNWLLATASVEGITGGAMIACIAAVMLPEAFERAGSHGNILLSSGFMCVCGFLLSVMLKANLG